MAPQIGDPLAHIFYSLEGAFMLCPYLLGHGLPLATLKPSIVAPKGF
jgi:hypothetical protein